MGGKNWFEISRVSKNRGFEKSEVRLQCLTEAKRSETCHGSNNREAGKTKGSKNWDSTVEGKG